MKGSLALALLAVFLALPAQAQLGLGAGYAINWLDVNGEDIELESVSAGLLYDTQVRDAGTIGLLDPYDWGWRAKGAVLKERGTTDDTAWILAFEFGPWIHVPGGFDVVLAGRYEHMTPAMLGDRTQTLGGALGLVFPVTEEGDASFAVGYHFAKSVSGVERVSSPGFYLGPEVAF